MNGKIKSIHDKLLEKADPLSSLPSSVHLFLRGIASKSLSLLSPAVTTSASFAQCM